MTIPLSELRDLLATAERAALAAGDVLRDWETRFTVSEKGRADLVTEADLAAQTCIHDLIARAYPSHGFLGEEGLSHAGTSDFRWVIDPLDGTSNYVHRFPYFAVSIGLECAGELLVGAILDPTRGELFTACKGGGAFLNGTPIQPSKWNRLSDAMLIASFPPGVSPEAPPIQRFLKTLPHAQTIHRSGSSALNLAYTAAGRIDGYWSTSLKPWDCAAGVLILREAGGRVTRLDGGPFELARPNLLASNGTGVHDELVGLFTSNGLT